MNLTLETQSRESKNSKSPPNPKPVPLANKLVLSRSEFKDKVYGCWLGKNIGGTFGAPHECKKYAMGMTFYEPVPQEAAANDDLDLQLVWLKMLEEVGTDPALPHFAEYWSKYASAYPWNEYGFFMRNFDRGLMPPIAGAFENYFVDEMGSPIRSEIWACLHPGNPDEAARMAWKDSAVDHAGGEGTYGEMFWCAVEAAAFVESDVRTLIRIGLNVIPVSCHIARVIKEVLWCFDNGKPWGETRERVATRFGHLQPCNAIPNHGFTIIGWLYGKDFGDQLCKAVNCGYDTDCTGATLGSVLGIIHGASGIPKKWVEPIGDQITIHKFTRNFTPPKNLTELTERTIALAEKAAALSGIREFGLETKLPDNLKSSLFKNENSRSMLLNDVNAGIKLCGETEVTFHYGGEPVLNPGIERTVWITTSEPTHTEVELIVPSGWSCRKIAPNRFVINTKNKVDPRNQLTVRLEDSRQVEFTILGPDEAKGFPAGQSVESCPKCRARIQSCFCSESC